MWFHRFRLLKETLKNSTFLEKTNSSNSTAEL